MASSLNAMRTMVHRANIDESVFSGIIFTYRPQGRFLEAGVQYIQISKLFINFTTMSQFIDYLKDTKAELKHVSWPTRRQATVATILVILISIFVAAFTGVFDALFTAGLDWFIK